MGWDRSLRECGLETVLARLYAHEINFGMQSFWDGGVDVWLGDEMNGIRCKANFDANELQRVPEWLVVNAEAHWPGLLKAPA